MALDKWTNNGLSTLASGIDASQTTATLATGTGSRFPADTFNVVIWNSTDYANPIDDPNREIVRCTSRSGDVLTITRAQESTVAAAHNTAGKTYSVALIVSQKFRDDLESFRQRTEDDLKTKILFDPSSFMEFYEDFEAITDTADPGVGAARSSKYRWFMRGGPPHTGAGQVGGVWRIHGDNTNTALISLPKDSTITNINEVFKVDRLPIVRVRWAQLAAAAATRRIGLAGSNLDTDPTNGIYFRHTDGGNIIAVARAAGVETTLDTLVAAANGVFHTGAFVANSTTEIEVFIDGASKGTLTANIPTVGLGIGAGSDNSTLNRGLEIDYLYVRQNRSA